MSHPRFHSYPYFTGALMTRLVRDVLMLSDGLSAFCFMGVSAFGFGGLAVSLVLWHFNFRWYTFFSSFRSSFRSEWSGGVTGNWLECTRSLEYCVPVASSSTVYDRWPSTVMTVPLDHRACFSSWTWLFDVVPALVIHPLCFRFHSFFQRASHFYALRWCCWCCQTGWMVLRVSLIWPASCETSAHRVKGYWHPVVCHRRLQVLSSMVVSSSLDRTSNLLSPPHSGRSSTESGGWGGGESLACEWWCWISSGVPGSRWRCIVSLDRWLPPQGNQTDSRHSWNVGRLYLLLGSSFVSPMGIPCGSRQCNCTIDQHPENITTQYLATCDYSVITGMTNIYEPNLYL